MKLINFLLLSISILTISYCGSSRPDECRKYNLPDDPPTAAASCAICSTSERCYFDETQAECDARQLSAADCRNLCNIMYAIAETCKI